MIRRMYSAAVTAQFIGHVVRAEKSGDDLEPAAAVKRSQHLQALDFVFDAQPIAALGFDGRGAVCQESEEIPLRAVFELVLRGRAQLTDAGPDPAAGSSDLLIGFPLAAHFVFVGARSGKYRMRVTVDESGHRHHIQTDAIKDLAVRDPVRSAVAPRVGPTQRIRSARIRIAPFSIIPSSDIEGPDLGPGPPRIVTIWPMFLINSIPT